MDGMTRVLQRIEDIEKRFGLMRHNQQQVENTNTEVNKGKFDQSVSNAVQQDQSSVNDVQGSVLRGGVDSAEKVMGIMKGDNSGMAGLLKMLPDLANQLQHSGKEETTGKSPEIDAGEAASRYKDNYFPIK